MTTRKFALAISTLTILSATACADIDERGPETSPATEQEPEQDPETEMTQITVSLDGLQSLGADFVYEGWLIVDGTPVSTGRFEIAENAESGEERGFWVAAADADAAGAFVLTIEPAQDDDAGPSAVKVLGGAIADAYGLLEVFYLIAAALLVANLTVFMLPKSSDEKP